MSNTEYNTDMERKFVALWDECEAEFGSYDALSKPERMKFLELFHEAWDSRKKNNDE